MCRSQCPRGLRRRSSTVLLLRLWVRIPLGQAWMSYECCVLTGRGLYDELITRPEESYWQWCVVVCGLENSWIRRPWPTGGGGGAVAPKTKKKERMYETQICHRQFRMSWHFSVCLQTHVSVATNIFILRQTHPCVGCYCWQRPAEMWWHTRRNQISSFGQTDESI